MFVVYASRDEFIVTLEALDSVLLEEYFNDNTGRDIDDYDRTVVRDSVMSCNAGLQMG